MKKLTSQQIRDTWLNFFKERGHMVEPGASLIPHNDPTLLWINAGVAALKKYFDGSEIPECKRITNVQKCIRTNDIDNVGRTARHHTFFEMLGNFSIGDYFRKEIVEWAFDILTNDKYFGLDKEKLYVTYHPDDLETRDLWIKQGLALDHLIPLEGNFWQIGEGPCGPNTEVFFDRGEKYDPEHIGIDLLKKDMENDRYIEIWGIVFSQFNAVNGVERKDYKELPHKNIDTGAGLERIACVLQETETNFETDLFMPYIVETQKLCNKPYEGEYLMPYRVIADHIRACTFALADGEFFSNEGRGYVLRRLLRRAMRYGQKLGFHKPFLYKLVPTVIEVMKGFYPYLIDKKDFLMKIIKAEEEKFIKTLNSGENILNVMIEDKKELSGEDAFKLYDTYGFPIELTVEICQDSGVSVDMEKFHECLNKQKELARNSRKNIESFNKQSKDLLDFSTPSTFTYDYNDLSSKVIGLFKDGVKVNFIEDEGDVIFEKTNFYAEMGGQVADTGVIENDNFNAIVSNVIKAPNKQHLHHIKVKFGKLSLNDIVTLKIDKERRAAIMRNHSATHLLQSALIKYVGNDVKQKGSFVNEEYLRFDFSHFEKIDQATLNKVEKEVNKYISMMIENKTLELPIEEAKKTGALAEFDEKYGDLVRVVCFGDISKEFCGGTHVKNTAEIGLFVIKSEESISAGVRRIEATTSLEAYKYLKQKEELLGEIRGQLGVKSNNEITSRLSAISNEMNEDKELIKKLNKEIFDSKANLISSSVKPENELSFVVKYFDGVNREGLIHILDTIKSKTSNYLVVISGDENNKHPLIVGIGKELISNGVKAGDVLKKVTAVCGGNGGGKPDRAQGNIENVDKLNFKEEDLK